MGLIFLFLMTFIYFGGLCAWAFACHSVYVEIKGQLVGVWFFFPPSSGMDLRSLGLCGKPTESSHFTHWVISFTPILFVFWDCPFDIRVLCVLCTVLRWYSIVFPGMFPPCRSNFSLIMVWMLQVLIMVWMLQVTVLTLICQIWSLAGDLLYCSCGQIHQILRLVCLCH